MILLIYFFQKFSIFWGTPPRPRYFSFHFQKGDYSLRPKGKITFDPSLWKKKGKSPSTKGENPLQPLFEEKGENPLRPLFEEKCAEYPSTKGKITFY